MDFEVELSWDGHEGGSALFEKGTAYQFDSPKEFGGNAVFPSPEEFFFSSVGACLMTSFLYFHRKLRFSMKTLKISVKGNLERKNDEGHRVTGLAAIILVEIDNGTEEKAKKCFEDRKSVV